MNNNNNNEQLSLIKLILKIKKIISDLKGPSIHVLGYVPWEHNILYLELAVRGSLMHPSKNISLILIHTHLLNL